MTTVHLWRRCIYGGGAFINGVGFTYMNTDCSIKACEACGESYRNETVMKVAIIA